MGIYSETQRLRWSSSFIKTNSRWPAGILSYSNLARNNWATVEFFKLNLCVWCNLFCNVNKKKVSNPTCLQPGTRGPTLPPPQSRRNQSRSVLPTGVSYLGIFLSSLGLFCFPFTAAKSHLEAAPLVASGLTFPRNLAPRSSPSRSAQFCERDYLRNHLASWTSEWHPGHTPFSVSPSPDPFIKGKLHLLWKQKEAARLGRILICCSQEGWGNFWKSRGLGQVQREVLRFQTFTCSHHCLGLEGKRLVGDPSKQSIVLDGCGEGQ